MTSTPTVAVAGGASAWRAVPLLTALGARQNVDVTVWSGESASSCPAVVDLLLATDLATFDRVRDVDPDVRVVAWVDDADQVAAVDQAGAQLVLAATPRIASTSVPPATPDSIDVTAWPALLPLVRRRWRERLGLPAKLVVAVDAPEVDRFVTTSLAVASAAVVTGPALPLALALGTPVVTSPEDAARLGLPTDSGPDAPALIAEDPAERDRAANHLASSPADLARRSVAARRFALDRLDLAPALRAVTAALRSSATDHPDVGTDPLGVLRDRLVELGTPPHSRIAERADAATAALRRHQESELMPHPAIDPDSATRLRAAGAGAAAPRTDPGEQVHAHASASGVRARAKSLVKKASAPVVDKARRAIEDSSRAEVEALQRELAALRSEVATDRARHRAEVAALRSEVAALRLPTAPTGPPRV
ncbi:MAG: hypothetical protein KDB02_15240 [Acidimicrobiales bacterium]|nr:hypothetical protein [Acidimicrobiales bacterium]